MADQEQEKTEEATDAKREEFRKRGQVAQSRELTSALFLLASAGGVFMLGRFFLQQIFEIFQYSIGQDMVVAARSGDLFTAMGLAGEKFILLVTPVLGIAFLIGVGSTIMQVGFLQVEDAFSPKFEKINPVDGFKRLFSLRALSEGVKALLKFILIAVIVYMIIQSELMTVPQIIHFSVEQMMSYLGLITVKLLAGIGLAMLVLSAADYFFQRWELNKQMMMTKEEVKQEHKNREGDPLIKARVRRIQRDVANRRMMEKVPKATVIVTNPTHIAVALMYDENLPAPQLVAKGADLMAEKIKAIAKEHNIPVIENKPLARTIFKTMKLGQVIPRELIMAVAEALSYVYKLRKKVRR